MPLSAGTRLGSYEILSALGAGGMGEVYRARDTRLDRDVAIKILPEAFAVDAERVARFQREAKVLASLNHPHIAAIYGLENADGVKALVLELVEGEDLAQRLTRGAIPLDEALPIAKQIAEALEVAHEQGIIHRDLKPANVKLRLDGTVKVLDFGLAKALEPALTSADVAQSPTITSPAMTRMGVILGTAAYMSPEQAKGRAADKRSDVWAFGCVLFEMLTAKRAFEGDDVSDTLASVLKGEADWNVLPHEVPLSIRALLKGCLTKDPRQRIADLSAALFVIDHQASLVPAVDTSIPAASLVERVPLWRRATAAAAVIVVAVAAAYGGWILRPAAPRAVTRFTIALPSDQTITRGGRHVVAISPDGTRVVYVANQQLYVRVMEQLDATPIRGTNEDPAEPVFSPDGQWIAYWAKDQWRKIPVTGGAPVTISAAAIPFGATWDGNKILFGAGADGIFEVLATGGAPHKIVSADQKASEVLSNPQLLPGGEAILFTAGARGGFTWDLIVQSLKTGERKKLVEGAINGRYLRTGHLIYALDGALVANAFDPARLALLGGPVSVLEGFVQAGFTTQVAVADAGSLVYQPGIGRIPTKALVWRDRQGRETAIKGAPVKPYIAPRLSPNGERIAVEVREDHSDIWIYHFANETLTPLTFGDTPKRFPLWTPDGKRILFDSTPQAGNRGVFWTAADGTGKPERLAAEWPRPLSPDTISPDGKLVVCIENNPTQETGADLTIVPLEAGGQPRPLLRTRGNQGEAEISPNGRWIAYQSNESGTFQVYVRPFPNVEQGQWKVSSDGGSRPLWAPNSRELFYVSPDQRLMAVPFEAEASFTHGKSQPLFDVKGNLMPLGGPVAMNFDISLDGKRFLMVKYQTTAGAATFVVVENWFEELKRRMATQ
jgi:eukaryotic-like serine/threonine-protein kinase